MLNFFSGVHHSTPIVKWYFPSSFFYDSNYSVTKGQATAKFKLDEHLGEVMNEDVRKPVQSPIIYEPPVLCYFRCRNIIFVGVWGGTREREREREFLARNS